MTGSARTVEGLEASMARSLTAAERRQPRGPYLLIGPASTDRRACPPRGVAQPLVMLVGVNFRDPYPDVADTPRGEETPWCMARDGVGPFCTRRVGHGGRHHAADGVHVWAVWGVRG